MLFDFTRKEKEYDAPLKITHCKSCIFFQDVSLMCAKYKMITDPEKTCKSHRGEERMTDKDYAIELEVWGSSRGRKS